MKPILESCWGWPYLILGHLASRKGVLLSVICHGELKFSAEEKYPDQGGYTEPFNSSFFSSIHEQNHTTYKGEKKKKKFTDTLEIIRICYGGYYLFVKKHNPLQP